MSAYVDMVDLYRLQLTEVRRLVSVDEYEAAAKLFFDTMDMFKQEPTPTDLDTISEEEAQARGKALMLMQTDCVHCIRLMEAWLKAHKPPEEASSIPKRRRR